MNLKKEIPTKTIILLAVILIPLAILLAHQAAKLKLKPPEPTTIETKQLNTRTNNIK